MATHRFEPTIYHNTLGTHDAVASIADGDTVITTTVDAHGLDAREEEVAPGPNPMTGPFFVEGAEPGDTLAITLEKIVPNRPFGWSAPVLAPNVVDPEYVSQEPPRPAGFYARWRVDNDAGVVTLVEPEDTRLGAQQLSLAPMVGCFGVAPGEGEAISTRTSARHGGNMDYRGFVAGTTAYFPVFVPGGLFFIGDGHAVQGAGEISGTGIEISFDVQFSVSLRKGGGCRWPRGEDGDWIFTVGNARPLDQALQHATTEMARWLTDSQAGFGLDPVGARVLMGQAVEYEVGNIFDPAYTIVCKLPKRYLASLRRS